MLITALKASRVQAFLAQQESLAPATYNQRLAALRSFTRWLCDQRWLADALLKGAGQSHLIFGTGSTSHVMANWFSKLCCIDALYKPPKNLDAIALLKGVEQLTKALNSAILLSTVDAP